MSQNERIQIEVTETGSRVVRRNLEGIGRSATTAASGVGFLQAALAALTFRGAASIIDSYTKMQNKLATVTKTQEQAAAMTQRLYEVANTTRQGIEGVTDSYFRFNGALEKLGYSQNQVIDLTETISKAFVVAGATADETERAMIQLAQGFSKNKLQTQDMKSVMEQAPYVIQVLARNLEGVGMSAQQAEFAMGDLAEQGKLTSKVMFNAFMKARQEIEERFLKTFPTIDNGLTLVRNSFNRWIGEAGRSSGVARGVADALVYLSENFDNVAKYATVALGILAGFGAMKLVFVAVAGAAALFTGSFLAIGALIGGVVAGIYAFGDGVKIAGSETLTLKGLATQAFTEAKAVASDWASDMLKKMPQVGKTIKKYLGTDLEFSLKGVLTFAYDVAQKMGVFFSAAAGTFIETWNLIPGAVWDIFARMANGATKIVADLLNKVYKGITTFVGEIIGKQFEEIRLGGLDLPVTGAADRMTSVFTQKVAEGLTALTPASQVIDGFYARAEANEKKMVQEQIANAEKLKAARAALKEKRPDSTPTIRGEVEVYVKELEKEAAALQLVNDQYTIRHAMNALEKQNNITLTAQEKEKVAAALQHNIELQRQKEMLESIKAPQTDYQNGLTALNQLMKDHKITVSEYNAQLDLLQQKYLAALPAAQTFTEGLARQLAIMQLDTKNAMGQMGLEIGKIFGPGGTLASGIGDAVAQSLVFGKSWRDQIRSVAQSILTQLISAIVKIGVNMALNAAMNAAMGAASTTQGVAQAGLLTAAYTPAAAAATLATGGSNAASAGLTLSGFFSMFTAAIGGLFGGGFKDGGYTGSVGTNQVAGLVHGQEFVMNAQATRRHRATLEALNSGKELGTTAMSPSAPPVNVSITNEIPDAAFEARALSETDVEIIAKRIVRRDAPEVIASDLRNPNGRSSRAITNNTTTGRRR